MRMLRFCDFIIKYVKIKQAKVEETQFYEKKLGTVVFHETKRVNKLPFVIVVNHITIVVRNMVYFLWVFNIRNITN